MQEMTRLPEGVFDALPQECALRRRVEMGLLNRFGLCGYDEVRTPVLEFMSLYGSQHGMRDSTSIKTFDCTGKTLILRPEFTTPIARLVSSRMQQTPRPLRLCYLGVAFRNQPDRVGLRRMEFTQAGVELLGLSGASADAEVIALAASSVAASGLRDFLIEVGQVDFFKGLMEEIGLGEDTAEALRQAVEQKNVLQMEMLLRSEAMSDKAMRRIMMLPSLYGGPEVIDQALTMTASPRCKKALDDLRQVYAILEGYGLADQVTIDLGMVHAVDYYSGAIFRGISGHLGTPILSGGRYDGLMDQFGSPTPATGFALGVERLMEALERQGVEEPAGGEELVVGCQRHDAAAMALIEGMRAQGKRVVQVYGQDIQELRAYAAQRGAQAVWIDEGGVARNE